MIRTLRIGTRGSALALRQTRAVVAALRAAHPDLGVETLEIRTSGDWNPAQGEAPLSALAGGKAQFAKEIEEALLAGAVDCGVHSLKDMPAFLPDGLAIDHVLSREDPRDVFLANGTESLETLPAGSVVGTSSVRRRAAILALRPDLRVVSLRGNVPTRIEKLRAGQVDAIVLAAAGLSRLGLLGEVSAFVEPSLMLPAAGQGIIGIETRADDAATRTLLDAVSCFETSLCAAAERGAMAALGGSCHTPAAAHAHRRGGDLFLQVQVLAPDGSAVWVEEGHDPARDPAAARALGLAVGLRVKVRVPSGILDTV
jgi:hydroxymethylbilane synthase